MKKQIKLLFILLMISFCNILFANNLFNLKDTTIKRIVNKQITKVKTKYNITDSQINTAQTKIKEIKTKLSTNKTKSSTTNDTNTIKKEVIKKVEEVKPQVIENIKQEVNKKVEVNEDKILDDVNNKVDENIKKNESLKKLENNLNF